MGEKIKIGSREDLIDAVAGDNDNRLDEDAVGELYDIWAFRAGNGSPGVLVTVPGWFSSNEFDNRRPAFFAEVEHDDDSKGAILFSEGRLVDVSIIENGIWDQVTISETLEMLDISDENDYIDEPGKIWIPRSLSTVYEWDA